MFIGLFGFFGVITGAKLVAGCLGAVWAYLAVVGAYELNRRRFAWLRGRIYSDWHLLAGALAVSTGLIFGGAMNETMPALAIVPALSAVIQANDGHDNRILALMHVAILVAGISVGLWFYIDGDIGKVLIDRVTALP